MNSFEIFQRAARRELTAAEAARILIEVDREAWDACRPWWMPRTLWKNLRLRLHFGRWS
jgi:hypothetical protein